MTTLITLHYMGIPQRCWKSGSKPPQWSKTFQEASHTGALVSQCVQKLRLHHIVVCIMSKNTRYITWLNNVYYLGWNRSPAQAGCVRQVLGPGALGRPRGIGWRGSWEGGSGWGTHVNPWLIHVSVWQKPLQCCKVISLQLIKINGKNCFIAKKC